MKSFNSVCLVSLTFLTCLSQLPRGVLAAPYEDRTDLFERRARWLHKQRAFPLDEIPAEARMRALEQIKKSKAASASTAEGGFGFHWFSIGPAPIGEGTSANSGRIATIAVDPADLDHWLIGAAQGGIWETWDAGLHWAPRTDDQPSLAMGAITFASSDPKIIYAGTGEANFAFVSYSGAGLLKSIDRGTNWFLLAASQFSQSAFSDIKVHPANPNTLMAATTRGVQGRVAAGTNTPPLAPPRGIFKSTNGGTNWTQKLSGEATDLEMDPGNFNRQYATLGEIFGDSTNGVYRSTNGGDTWTAINGPWTGLLASTNTGRIEMAISTSDPDTLYVGVSRKRNTSPALLGIWRTDNAWATTPIWTQLTNPSLGGGQIWYYFEMLVNPANPSVLYLGELELQRYSLGTWTVLTGPMHVDQHAFAWAGSNPDGPRMVVGNDGGLWVSSYGVGSWSNRNRDLALTQFYEGSVHPTEPDLVIGGSQDNGTVRFTGDLVWERFSCCDGGDNAISSSQPETHWAVSYQTTFNVNIYRTKDGGANKNHASSDISPDYAPFIVRFEKHPSNDELFIVGTVHMWKCANFFSAPVEPSWSTNSPVLLKTDGERAEITALGFAPADGTGQIYAYGTEDGQLRITSNGGADWTNLDPDSNVPDRYVTDLAFDPVNSSVLYVTLSGFDEGTPSAPGHVFKTTNALTQAGAPVWMNISPPVNLPVNSIVVNPTFSDQVVLGTDLGVWQSNTGGGTWLHFGPSSGLPNAAVFELQMNSAGRLTAFTHGRGAFVLGFNFPEIVESACPVFPCQIWWINPLDLVTFDFPLRSIIQADTVDLVARLRPTAQIQPKSAPKSYGALEANGPPVTQSFTFVAGGGFGAAGDIASAGSFRCGDMVEAILDLEDRGVRLGSVAFPIRLGRPNEPLAEDFERLTPPELPANWRVDHSGAGSPWASSTNPPPNAVPSADPDEPNDPPDPRDILRNTAAFAPAPERASDNRLYSAPIPSGTDNAQLSFRHSFDFERAMDGGVLELSIDGAEFEDIERAGGSFVDNGYNTRLSDRSPLPGRQAWSGNAGGFIVTRINLPAATAGRTIQFCWRGATDDSQGGKGWWIDNINVTEFQCLNPVSDPVIVRPRLVRGDFAFSFATVSGRDYIVECKTSLEEAAWKFQETVAGDGTEKTLIIPRSAATQRFYRFRVE